MTVPLGVIKTDRLRQLLQCNSLGTRLDQLAPARSTAIPPQQKPLSTFGRRDTPGQGESGAINSQSGGKAYTKGGMCHFLRLTVISECVQTVGQSLRTPVVTTEMLVMSRVKNGMSTGLVTMIY